MPQTVPKRPIKGVALPVVARNERCFPSRYISMLPPLSSVLVRLFMPARRISSVSSIPSPEVVRLLPSLFSSVYPIVNMTDSGQEVPSWAALWASDRFLLCQNISRKFSLAWRAALKRRCFLKMIYHDPREKQSRSSITNLTMGPA